MYDLGIVMDVYVKVRWCIVLLEPNVIKSDTNYILNSRQYLIL